MEYRINLGVSVLFNRKNEYIDAILRIERVNVLQRNNGSHYVVMNRTSKHRSEN